MDGSAIDELLLWLAERKGVLVDRVSYDLGVLSAGVMIEQHVRLAEALGDIVYDEFIKQHVANALREVQRSLNVLDDSIIVTDWVENVAASSRGSSTPSVASDQRLPALRTRELYAQHREYSEILDAGQLSLLEPPTV